MKKRLISLCKIGIFVFLLIVPISAFVTLKMLYIPTCEFKINDDSFSEENLISLINDMNFKYPHIVLSQAKIESGNYSSFIFRNNNNLFGMRHPTVRITTSKGPKFTYASYLSWRESVIDYGLFMSRLSKELSSEEDYYKFLGSTYAENPQYVVIVKKIADTIKDNKIFSKN